MSLNKLTPEQLAVIAAAVMVIADVIAFIAAMAALNEGQPDVETPLQ